MTTVNTGDVPLGVPYKFQWNTSADGRFKYSNCSYTGDSVLTTHVGVDECITQCTSSSFCDTFSWWGCYCNLKSKSANQVINLALTTSSPDAKCGSVINRANFAWKSGSNGLATYSQNCDYACYNRQQLQWQYSDQALD